MKHNDNQQYVNLIISSVTPILKAAHVSSFYIPIIIEIRILLKKLFPQINVYWHTYGTAVHMSTQMQKLYMKLELWSIRTLFMNLTLVQITKPVSCLGYRLNKESGIESQQV